MRRGGDPPPVGRFNAGQKANAILVGLLLLAVTVSGLYWSPAAWMVANSNVDGAVHNVAAVAIIVLVCGHLYMAVFNPGTRGALRGIVTGRVDAGCGRRHPPLAPGRPAAGGVSRP